MIINKLTLNLIALNADEWGDVAPDWKLLVNWNEKFKGKPGIPNEALYVCYTDQKTKFNPSVIPTSILFKNNTDAKNVFGFIPSIVDFDVKSKMVKNGNSVYFRPMKQVPILW